MTLSRIAELERELDATRKELQSAIHDLEIANEEQKAINQEAMSANEEFQSTNEELMTSREELQSLNEELTALNSQLQETLERQRSTSNDLQNILDSSGVATLFLDSELNIRFFTPAAKSLFRVIATDIGRPLADLARRINDTRPARRRRDSSCRPRAAEPRGRGRRRSVVHPSHPALPHPGRPGCGGGHHLRRHIGEESGRTGRSRQRDPIPTASSTPFASRSLCSMRSFTSSPRAAPSTASFRSSPSRPWARQLDAIDEGRLDIAALRVFLDRLRNGERVVEDHEIDVELPPRGMRSLLVSALDIRDEPPAMRKILLTIEDITERKHAAEALEAAKRQAEQANLGKSRFLAAASHDLRQPLQTISLLHELLAKKVKDETTLKLVGKLDETVSTMSSMLDTLLDINQLEAGIVRGEMIDFPINDRARASADAVRLPCGGAWPRLACRPEQPQRAQRSPPARADDPQPALERGEIHRCGQDPARLPAARRQIAHRGLGYRKRHSGRGASRDFRGVSSAR